MWLLSNETPFAAERSWVRDERGAEFWLVVVRASFEIRSDGSQVPAAHQTEVQRAPIFAGDPARSGLIVDTDFMLSKSGTDILVRGQAFAPNAEPAPGVAVRVAVGGLQKTLHVIGDRVCRYDGLAMGFSDPRPFTAMPIGWERTFGGWDDDAEPPVWLEENPAGRGFARDGARLHGKPAPNVEYPDSPYRGPGVGRPAAFGPVAPHWTPRVGYAGTYDEAWQKDRDPLVPADFDRRYYHTAPTDQQTAKPLVGYEEVNIFGMTPEGRLSFRLPRILFDVITTFRGRGDVSQVPEIHTLWILPDRYRFELIYLSALEVPPGQEEKLVGSTIRIRPRIGTPDSVRATGVWMAE